MKFRIDNITPSYELETAIQPVFNLEDSLRSLRDDERDDTIMLYLFPQARNVIFKHIGWGEKNNHNIVEQGGLLVGRSFKDPQTGEVYGIVEHAIAGVSAVGSSVYLEMNHDVWEQMIKEADALIDQKAFEKCQIIGWYHTHPNNLPVFMSGTDMGTQRKFFNKNWQFAIVLNPHKKIWKAFNGEDAVSCLGEMVNF